MNKRAVLASLLTPVLVLIVGCGGQNVQPTATFNLTGESTLTTRGLPNAEITAEVTSEVTPEVTAEAALPYTEMYVGLDSDVIYSVPAQEPVTSTPTELCEAAVPAEEPANREFEAAEEVLETGVDYRAIFCTDAGPIYIDLYERYTPVTVNNFIFLAEQGYYNNIIFHRVIADFMAQGGDPTATGGGGPGYQFQDEFVGFLTFDSPGLLAMANAGPGTNGSQFFITTAPTPHLNFAHTIFGEVLEGQESVDNIQLRDPEQGGVATTLQAVVIVTDPATVETTFVEDEPATEADVVDSMTDFAEQLAQAPVVVTNAESPISATLIVDTADEALKEGYEAYLADHNHEFRYSSEIDNANCDIESVSFYNLTYTVDAFESGSDAAAAADDAFVASLLESEGYTAADGEVFTKEVSICDTSAISVVKYIQRGKFLARVEGIIPAEAAAQAADYIDQLFIPLYDQALASAYRKELR